MMHSPAPALGNTEHGKAPLPRLGCTDANQKIMWLFTRESLSAPVEKSMDFSFLDFSFSRYNFTTSIAWNFFSFELNQSCHCVACLSPNMIVQIDFKNQYVFSYFSAYSIKSDRCSFGDGMSSYT